MFGKNAFVTFVFKFSKRHVNVTRFRFQIERERERH